MASLSSAAVDQRWRTGQVKPGFPALALLRLQHKPSCFQGHLEGFAVQLPLEKLRSGEGAGGSV